jgi:hypothetical protein
VALEPSLDDPTPSTPASRTRAFFRSTDGREELARAGGAPRRAGEKVAPGAGGLGLHTILFDPDQPPSRIYIRHLVRRHVPHRRRRRKTWKTITRGLHSKYIPNPTAEVGHCVHRIALNKARRNTLFMQKHWDVMRSDDAATNWRKIAGNCRATSASPSTSTPTSPTRSTSCRSRATSSTYPPEGKLRVYRSKTAATSGSRSPRACRRRTAT